MSDQIVTVVYRVPDGEWEVGQVYPRVRYNDGPEWADGEVTHIYSEPEPEPNLPDTLANFDRRLRQLEKRR